MTSRSDEISVFLEFEPDIPTITHQNGVRPAVNSGKLRYYKTSDLRQLEAQYISLLKPHAPAEPWDCPIHLTTVWYFRAPEKIKLRNAAWKTTKPDTDNLVKTLKDCMKKAGFFVDDALVCFDSIAKFFVPADSMHGVHIRLAKLKEKETPLCQY